MRVLVPYAGYDPTEDQFGSSRRYVASSQNFAIARLCRKRIDIGCARKLRTAGLDYRAIGQLLARQQGRATPYAARSVYRAVNA